VAVILKFFIVDWPEDAKFLREEERAVLIARLQIDRREEANMDRWNTKRVLSDWKIWLGCVAK
jgi:hypothetical protein